MEDAKSMRALKPESAALPDDAPHLLVVDDDRRIRDLLSRFLLGEGYRVTTAESAAEARAKLAGLRFDLMILDVMMPGETGFEFARALRINNILKRTAPPQAAALEKIAFGPYVFHFDRSELREGEEVVHLTDREREMLRILAEAPGETVPRQALAGNGSAIGERAVDVQVNRLRRKIEQDPANPLLIQTVRGIGYRLVTTP